MFTSEVIITDTKTGTPVMTANYYMTAVDMVKQLEIRDMENGEYYPDRYKIEKTSFFNSIY